MRISCSNIQIISDSLSDNKLAISIFEDLELNIFFDLPDLYIKKLKLAYKKVLLLRTALPRPWENYEISKNP